MTRAGRSQPGSRRPVLVIRQRAGRIAAVLADCRYAQRRVAVLQASPDRYLPDPDLAPEIYREFLFRTSGLLVREPAASSRSWRAVR